MNRSEEKETIAEFVRSRQILLFTYRLLFLGLSSDFCIKLFTLLGGWESLVNVKC